MKTTHSTTREVPGPETGFRRFLQSDLARRCARSPKYSLRAHAMRLGVDHSTLSQWLRGKRRLTADAIRRVGAKLGLDRARIDAFIAAEPRVALDDDGAARETRSLTRDVASLVGDWHHFAILELVRLKEFRPDSRWIARVLGLSVDEVNLAITRLIHLDLLDMASPRRWVDKSGDARATFAGFTQAAIQRLSEQVRALSDGAMRAVPATLQEHSSTTFAVSSARLPEAFALLERLRREVIACLERGDARDDVYRLEIGLFPVTTLKHDPEKRWATP